MDIKEIDKAVRIYAKLRGYKGRASVDKISGSNIIKVETVTGDTHKIAISLYLVCLDDIVIRDIIEYMCKTLSVSMHCSKF
jgi:hypothetical protein